MEIDKQPRRLINSSLWTYLTFLVLLFPIIWIVRPKVPTGENVKVIQVSDSNEALLFTSIPLERYVEPIDKIAFKSFDKGLAKFHWFKLTKKEKTTSQDQLVYRVQFDKALTEASQDTLSGFVYLRKRRNRSLGGHLIR